MRRLVLVSVLAVASACGGAMEHPGSGASDADAGPGFDYEASLSADFPERDLLPQTEVPEDEWFDQSSWGPPAATYPEVEVPLEIEDVVQWKRDRVIAVAKHFIGVKYEHFHIPAAGGLDCSNFTSWVYNYGFGIRFTSHVVKQSAAPEAGRLLADGEEFKTGDLLFIKNSKGEIGHVIIYIDEDHIIDSTTTTNPPSNGVKVRSFAGWYKKQYSHARRIFE